MLPASIFCDGGVIKKNPSSYGGTWAFVWVSARGEALLQGSGILTPSDVDLAVCSNNLMELYAAMRALSSVPRKWHGTLFTDSQITLYRVTSSPSFNGIPQWLRDKVLTLRRGRKYRVELVGGHPTKNELLTGKLKRNGFAVSEWNVWCDKECGRLAKQHIALMAR